MPFNSTFFGKLYVVVDQIINQWPQLSNADQKDQQMRLVVIGKAANALLKASTEYNSAAAYFTDGILNGLFSYWPFFPYGLSPPATSNDNSTATSWHEKLSNTIQYFLQLSLYSDYSGQPNPSQGSQLF